MTTSRVPGLTRNSGWQAINAMIVESRAPRQQHTGTPTTVEPRAETWSKQRHGAVDG